MAKKYPRDRFDSPPAGLERVGAHRAPQRRGRRWLGVVWAVLATLVLIGIGVVALMVVDGSLGAEGAQPTRTVPASPAPTPSVAPTAATGGDFTAR